MSTNLNAIREFFDPHPGFVGASIPIPSKVKRVADELNGKSVSLREAINKIQAVTNGKVLLRDKWIALELHETDGTRHSFRVIRFR